MKRKKFVSNILGASILLSMDGFSSMANAISTTNKEHKKIPKFATFGAIHLNITNLKKAIQFWTTTIGMKLRESSENKAEFGSEDKTLVVVHQNAKTGFKKGYSGLYHVAIHLPNEEVFANLLYRFMVNKYPISPVDHTMSKSIYLDDPDGINIEFTLETPERFKRVVTENGIGMEDAEGNIRSASSQLDLNEILEHLIDKDLNTPFSAQAYIGHLHLYANNVDKSNAFYKKMGFIEFNDLPQFRYADVGAGGDYQHRIVMNSWHGVDRPLAPSRSAGMKHFQINFSDQKKLEKALESVSKYEEKEGGYWFLDPTGNQIFLKYI